MLGAVAYIRPSNTERTSTTSGEKGVWFSRLKSHKHFLKGRKKERERERKEGREKERARERKGERKGEEKAHRQLF